jgi:hypothetical protein
MQNVNAISRVAMFHAECVTATGTSRSRPGTIPPYGASDRLAAGDSLRCRWGAAADGTLRMEWHNTPIT